MKKPAPIPWIRGPGGLGGSGLAVRHDRLFLSRNLFILSNFVGSPQMLAVLALVAEPAGATLFRD
jgi:hypothetical protein